jgi:hypothetical protein
MISREAITIDGVIGREGPQRPMILKRRVRAAHGRVARKKPTRVQRSSVGIVHWPDVRQAHEFKSRLDTPGRFFTLSKQAMKKLDSPRRMEMNECNV